MIVLFFLLVFAGFLFGWVVASAFLMHKASEAAAICFHDAMNTWREVLESALLSADVQRAEKIKFVVSEIRMKLGEQPR